MAKNTEYDRRVSLRLPGKLCNEIEEFIEPSGMSFTEFLRRACREKLDRDRELETISITKEELRAAIQSELRSMMDDGTYSGIVAERSPRYGLREKPLKK